MMDEIVSRAEHRSFFVVKLFVHSSADRLPILLGRTRNIDVVHASMDAVPNPYNHITRKYI